MAGSTTDAHVIDLVEARAIRAAIADGTPPEGWPLITALGSDKVGEPVPKCSLIPCTEPGIFRVSCIALASEFTGMTSNACPEHLDHFALSSAEWVRT